MDIVIAFLLGCCMKERPNWKQRGPNFNILWIGLDFAFLLGRYIFTKINISYQKMGERIGSAIANIKEKVPKKK